MLNTLATRLKSFVADTRGSVSVEFILVMPFLFWAFMATYVYFDGFRQSALNLKATYTISDLISRETETINDEYIGSMHSLMELMTNSRSSTSLRITVIRWVEADSRYYVDWSANRGYNGDLNDANIGDIKDRLPVMPDNERVILVESINTFIPAFKIGMENKKLENFVFTRPRFAPQVLYADS
jgi:Flp pilus assembly protein TadG